MYVNAYMRISVRTCDEGIYIALYLFPSLSLYIYMDIDMRVCVSVWPCFRMSSILFALFASVFSMYLLVSVGARAQISSLIVLRAHRLYLICGRVNAIGGRDAVC